MTRLLALGLILLSSCVFAAEKPPTTKQLTTLIEKSMRASGRVRNGKLLKIHGVESTAGASFYHEEVAYGRGGWLPFHPRSLSHEWAVKVEIEYDKGFGERAQGIVIVLIDEDTVTGLVSPHHFRIR
jgi:hypothetical protein